MHSVEYFISTHASTHNHAQEQEEKHSPLCLQSDVLLCFALIHCAAQAQMIVTAWRVRPCVFFFLGYYPNVTEHGDN